MNTRYKILFSITLLHDYYNEDQIFGDLEIEPTEKTKRLFAGYRILYRAMNNNLLALIEVDDSDKPFVKMDSNTPMRFIIKSKNPVFRNISALKLFDSNNSIYYFSNQSDNETDGTLYLSKPVPGHSSGEDYEVGSLIQVGSDILESVSNNIGSPPPDSSWRKLSPQRFPEYIPGSHSEINKGTIVFDPAGSKNYEAIKFVPKGQSVPVSNTDYWKEVSALQYVSSEDLIDIDFISIGTYDIDKHADIQSGTVLFNEIDSKLYKALKFIGKGNAVPVSDADHWLEVSVPRFVKSKDTLNKEDNVFGVIDLFLDNTVTANYKMLGAAGEVKEIKYAVRFKNRITTWKYVSQKNTVTNLSDTGGTFNFIKTNNEFISDSPIPLMLKPFQNFFLTSNTGTQTITVEKLQCASSYIKPNEATKSFISEIYLNY